MRWIQTPSDYDFLVAATMSADWAHRHKPVISRRCADQIHTLYSKFSFEQPGGEIVLCHRRCGQPLKSRLDVKTNKVAILCPGCGSKCKVPKVVSDRTTVLGRRGIVKSAYPQTQFPTEWKNHVPSQPGLSPSFSRSVTPALPPSSHQPSPTPSLRKRSPVGDAQNGTQKKKKKKD